LCPRLSGHNTGVDLDHTMTAIGNRPAEITTLEQELVRLALAYFFTAPKNTFQEEINLNTPWCVFDIKPNPEGRIFFMCRFGVELNALVDGTPDKVFKRAKETIGGTSTLPVGFDTV
jgi:hypothetical protein